MARRFVDARGTEWEVWEVAERQGLADRAPRPRRVGAGSTGGWLRFDSATQSRRLTRYPAWWSALDAPALAELCAAARLEWAPSAGRIGGGRADVR